MNKDRIIKELSLIPFGNKGWMHSDDTPCIFGCERTDKFGILFLPRGGVVKCMRCGESTSLFNYLLKINRRDLIEGFSAPTEDILKSLNEEIVDQTVDLPETSLPRGFKRIFYDDYLDSRSFTAFQYNYFRVGLSTDISLKEHLIFPIYQDNMLVSWLGRTRHSKEWHKHNIMRYKENKARLIPRYKNSTGTEFSDILAFSDDIIIGVTNTVILVEGLFDKANIDRLLNLHERDDVKCCFTFGKNLSKNQVNILLKKKVKNVILMYDPDAIQEIEKFSLNYLNKIDSIFCAKLIDKDPGDLNIEELNDILRNLKSPYEYYFNNIKRI